MPNKCRSKLIPNITTTCVKPFSHGRLGDMNSQETRLNIVCKPGRYYPMISGWRLSAIFRTNAQHREDNRLYFHANIELCAERDVYVDLSFKGNSPVRINAHNHHPFPILDR